MKSAFFLGAVGYPLLEILYRGRTHYSMAIAGGLSTAVIARLSKASLSFAAKAICGGAAITGIEFLCGCIWNRNYAVWDYRRLPMNYAGQICLPYSLVWCGLSAAAICLFTQCSKGRT